jgi:hypothetical protein
MTSVQGASRAYTLVRLKHERPEAGNLSANAAAIKAG